MAAAFGDSFSVHHVQTIGMKAPECWNDLIARLDNADYPWNHVLFLEDDIALPEHGLAMLFLEMLRARENDSRVMGATVQTYVHRYNRGGRIGAIAPRKDQPHFVWTTGWYCLLVDRRAYEIVEHDYRSIQGQDIQFCKGVNRAGLRIIAVPGVEVPHFYVRTFQYKKFENVQWTGAHVRERY